MIGIEEFGKLLGVASDMAVTEMKNGDPSMLVELLQEIDGFGKSVKEFIDKHDQKKGKKPFRFRIEPIKFDGDDL